jgi:GT2 family glycosyltransferase
MPALEPTSSVPRVAAVLVVSDGAAWLPSVLATVAAQRYPALDLVVVDNATSDGAAELLGRRIPGDRLVTLPQRVGFGRAVAAAVAHPLVDTAELVFLLHDDLALAPNALAHLVRALREDPTLAIVGPKLREWRDEPVLSEVGMTIDRLGRAESLLEPGELDQGQHDRQREVLYVSTAGMLLRRDVLRAVGGFDPRFELLRDDLDLCWRAALAGARIEVVPAAVGYHIAAASRGLRAVGKGRPWEPREFAERHSFAALLKNYGAARLAWVAPLVVLLALGKVLAFLATRRFGDALAVTRAYGWNFAQLPRTLRRRRAAQARREVSDGELARLFAPGIPRVRAYAEALSNWVAGGSTRALYDDAEQATPDEAVDPLADRPLRRLVRDRPAASAGLVVGLIYLVGILPLLGDGPIVGGAIAPWPTSAREFLRVYASPWNGEPAASAAFASPIQPLLGFASFLGFGSAWLAQRLLVLGLPVLAWLTALRAGRLVTARPAPRALGATLYALSPVVVGALAQGRYGELVVAALLPGLVLVAARAGDPRTGAAAGWRASALLALGVAAAVAAAPALGPLLALGYGAGLLVALRNPAAPGERPPVVRFAVAGAGALGLLAPWLVGLALRGALPPTGVDARPFALWRALTLVPPVLPGLEGIPGLLAAAVPVAVVALALLLGLRQRPAAVAGLVAVAVLAAVATWLAAAATLRWLWAPALLLPAALAVAALGVIAARWLSSALRAYAFGARQLAVVVSVVVVALGLAGAGVRVAGAPWTRLARDPGQLPAFVTADESRVGPYRVLLVRDDGTQVSWDVTGSTGPTMRDFGATSSVQLLDFLGDTVADAVGGADLQAGQRLGLANVRYVVVAPDGVTAELVAALARQPALEPVPAGGGRVYRVRTWLPRAVVLPPDRADALLAGGDLGDTGDLEEQGLDRISAGRYAGPARGPGLVVVSEADSDLWRVAAPRAERVAVPGVNAFRKPEATERTVAFAAGGVRHRLVIALQVLLLLGIVSLALRPPGALQRRAERAQERALPSALETDAAPDPEPEAPAPRGPEVAPEVRQ